jgi:hypothetical protein
LPENESVDPIILLNLERALKRVKFERGHFLIITYGHICQKNRSCNQNKKV